MSIIKKFKMWLYRRKSNRMDTPEQVELAIKSGKENRDVESK